MSKYLLVTLLDPSHPLPEEDFVLNTYFIPKVRIADHLIR